MRVGGMLGAYAAPERPACGQSINELGRSVGAFHGVSNAAWGRDGNHRRTWFPSARLSGRTCLVMALLGCLPVCACAQEVTSNEPSWLSHSTWSAVRDISGIPDGRTMRSPFLSHYGDTLYLSANTFPIRATAGVGLRPAVLLRLPGQPLPLPPGQLLFAYPKGVVDHRGTYHLFWGESSAPAAERRFRIPTVTSLWHAEWHHSGWSAPEQLLAGKLLRWGADQGTPVVDAAGRIHVLLTASLDELRDVSVHLRRKDDRWETRRINPAATYAALIPWHGDTLVAAFVAADSAIRSGTNNVFTTMTTDGGVRWSRPRLAGSFGTRLSTAPTLAVGGETLHLVWAQNLRGGAPPQVLRHQFSRDGGVTWQSAEDAPLLHDGELGFSLAASECEAASALIESIVSTDGATRVVVDEMRWAGREVQGAQLFPEHWITAGPRILALNGKFHMVGSTVVKRGEIARTVQSSRGACRAD